MRSEFWQTPTTTATLETKRKYHKTTALVKYTFKTLSFFLSSHEQVDVSFFDPGHNGSVIDLSNIPVPIQTNISGITVTGILPADLGQINLNENGTATINGSTFPIFPNKQIKVTHNISTIDKDKSASILSGLPKILGLDELLKTKSNDTREDEDGTSVEALTNSDDDEKEAR